MQQLGRPQYVLSIRRLQRWRQARYLTTSTRPLPNRSFQRPVRGTSSSHISVLSHTEAVRSIQWRWHPGGLAGPERRGLSSGGNSGDNSNKGGGGGDFQELRKKFDDEIEKARQNPQVKEQLSKAQELLEKYVGKDHKARIKDFQEEAQKYASEAEKQVRKAGGTFQDTIQGVTNTLKEKLDISGKEEEKQRERGGMKGERESGEGGEDEGQGKETGKEKAGKEQEQEQEQDENEFVRASKEKFKEARKAMDHLPFVTSMIGALVLWSYGNILPLRPYPSPKDILGAGRVVASGPLGKGAKLARDRVKDKVEDVQEAWETSQHPMVYTVSSAWDSMTAESELAVGIKELRRLDPSFNVEDWKADMVEHFLPDFMSAFLEGDAEMLGEWTGEACRKKLEAEVTQRKADGVMVDPHVLDIRQGEVLAIKMDANRSNPIVALQFMCQQINCVRNRPGMVRWWKEQKMTFGRHTTSLPSRGSF
ncbi:unnamed protein product [Discosporangium mesarthrocarpum]